MRSISKPAPVNAERQTRSRSAKSSIREARSASGIRSASSGGGEPISSMSISSASAANARGRPDAGAVVLGLRRRREDAENAHGREERLDQFRMTRLGVPPRRDHIAAD